MGYTVNYSMADPYTLPGHLVAGGPDGASTYADPAQSVTGPGSDAAGTSDKALFVDDETEPDRGHGDPAATNVALLTNCLASTFATPAGDGTGTVVAQASDQAFLAKPVA